MGEPWGIHRIGNIYRSDVAESKPGQESGHLTREEQRTMAEALRHSGAVVGTTALAARLRAAEDLLRAVTFKHGATLDWLDRRDAFFKSSVPSQKTPRAEPVQVGRTISDALDASPADYVDEYRRAVDTLNKATDARLAEWRAARTAIFQHQIVFETRKKDREINDPELAALFGRLADAENALMALSSPIQSTELDNQKGQAG